MFIGTKLKKVLKQKNISLADLSGKSGIGRKDCKAILENQKEPTLEVFVQIVNALGILPSDFIETEGRDTRNLLVLQRKIDALPLEEQMIVFKEIKNNLP